jgi:hypothetical protein
MMAFVALVMLHSYCAGVILVICGGGVARRQGWLVGQSPVAGSQVRHIRKQCIPILPHLLCA